MIGSGPTDIAMLLSALSAVVEGSFDMRDYDHINFKKFDRQIVADAASSLIDGLPKISLQSGTTAA